MVYFTSFWFGFVVVWSLRFSGTSGNFRIGLQERWRRTAVFFTSMVDPLTSFVFVTSLPWTHGLRTDCMICFWNFTPDANFSWQMWRTSTSISFRETPDALIGKLRFSDFYFRDDCELLEVFEHCTSIFVELTPWKTSVGKVPSHWGSPTSSWKAAEVTLSLLAALEHRGKLQRETSYIEKQDLEQELHFGGDQTSVRGETSWGTSGTWTKFQAATSYHWSSTSKTSRTTSIGTSRLTFEIKVVDFRMAGNNQRMNFVNMHVAS